VRKTLETKPQLIQISAAWNSREGAPLGRNQCVELEIKKPRPNGASTKLPANQKPCDKMAEAIVMSALSKRVGRDHTTAHNSESSGSEIRNNEVDPASL
jgi:hypothetical protein